VKSSQSIRWRSETSSPGLERLSIWALSSRYAPLAEAQRSSIAAQGTNLDTEDGTVQLCCFYIYPTQNVFFDGEKICDLDL
jgi:hypothetical protein